MPADPDASSDVQLHLDPALRRALGEDQPDRDRDPNEERRLFERVLALQGEIHRTHKARRTFRTRVGGIDCFVKIHGGAGWREILKHVARGRTPVLTADPEARAVQRLRRVGVPTLEVLGHGRRGRNPAAVESFLITRALDDHVELDAAAKEWGGLPARDRARLRRRAIDELASIVARMHAQGINHRDCYLCHFLLPRREWRALDPRAPLGLRVIDLHRAQIRRRVPDRWRAKDLAGLLFSSLDLDLSRREILRFARGYFGRDWKNVLRRRPLFLARVNRRARSLFRSHHGRPAPSPG